MRQSGQFQDITQLQVQMGLLQQQVYKLTLENNALKQQLNSTQTQLSLSKKSEDVLQQKIIEYEKLLQEQSIQYQQTLIQVQQIPDQLQLQVQQLLEEKDKLLNDFKDQTWIYKKTIKNYESLTASVQAVFSDKKEKVPTIKGLMEKLMEQQYKIGNWKSNPKIRFEIQEFEIFEIKLGKHMNKILDKKLFFLAHEGLQVDSIGQIKAQISLQPNVEGDHQVGYIIEILNAQDESLKSKFLLRRESKQQQLSQGYSKKQEAIQQSMNNMLCQALLDRFKKKFQGYEQFNAYSIQRQFILQPSNLKLFYYCEMIEEGEFQKFNGGNMEPIINTELEDYIHFYTFDSFQDMNEQLVVSHMQRFGLYFHDMIVSTFIGVYSQYDQGKQEVTQTIKNLERALGFTSQTIK